MTNLQLADKLPVRVALLDNGCKLQGLNGKKQKGNSFRPDKEAYFVGPCEHGTHMAKCIRDVWPQAQLLIARLDDSQGLEKGPFTIASCYEASLPPCRSLVDSPSASGTPALPIADFCRRLLQALKWVLDMGVDIVSMSWSFKKRDCEKDYYKVQFIELVKKATSNGVIFFGSLPDVFSALVENYVPIGLPGVISIGSATVFGLSSLENSQTTPDFLLPGEELELEPGRKSQGSSYATAYAAGLAAVMLHCVQARLEFVVKGKDPLPVKALTYAKSVDGMRVIFRRLSQQFAKGEFKRGAFVQPFINFDNAFKNSKREGVLETIVNDVLPVDLLVELE